MAGGALKTASMDDFDLRMSEGVRPLYEAVKTFIADEVEPITEEFYRLGREPGRSLELGAGSARAARGREGQGPRAGAVELLPARTPRPARACRNLDYAYIAVELGKNRLASECLNCSAPDTGNMEVLERVGTPEQKEQWLEPLLRRRDPLGLRDDRARRHELRREADPDPRRARRRRVGDQRREVLHLRRRRSPLQDHDRHGAHQPRCRHLQAAVADPRADGHPRRRDRRADGRVRQRRRPARPHAHPLHRRARAEEQRAVGRGQGLRDLPGPPRPGPHPPLHALHRCGRAGASR